MNDTLKIDLESLVKDFEISLNEINISDFDSSQKFVNKCQDLLNSYIVKLNFSVPTFSTSDECFLEDYIPSLEYHRKCQQLFEQHLQKSLQK